MVMDRSLAVDIIKNVVTMSHTGAFGQVFEPTKRNKLGWNHHQK